MTRYEKLLTQLPQEADAALITSEKNQRYFSGFDFTDGYVLLTRRGAYLFTDFRYTEAAKREVKPEFTVVQLEKGAAKDMLPYLESDGVHTLAYEDGFVTCRELSQLREMFPDRKFVPLGTAAEDMREIKDAEEVGNIVRAQRIAEDALARILPMLKPEMTEIEVAAELEYAMRRGGASGTSFDTIAISGTLTSSPHGVPRNARLEKGFLTMDFGAMYGGYCSDMTRTVCLGRPTDEMIRVYDTVRAAQAAGLAALAPGADCGEADKAARDIIDNAGYKGAFGHSLGHGVGMFIHERPNLAPRCFGMKLKPGHVVTAEPGIYLPGKFGVRIEDMVLIEENGVRNLTNAPKSLVILENF